MSEIKENNTKKESKSVVLTELEEKYKKDPAFQKRVDAIEQGFEKLTLHEIALYKEATNEIATTDLLTGLKNRRGLMEHVSGILISEVIMGDLDNLKKVNDSLGHEEGDRFIINVANVLKQQDGFSARMGGDEFVVIPNNLANADDIVLKILSKVENLKEQGQIPEIAGVSMGVARRKSTETFNDLLKRADKEMYEDKKTKNTCGKFPNA